MNNEEYKRSLYEKQLYIREKIASEAGNIVQICKGELKRGKVVSDKWSWPYANAQSMLGNVARMEKALADLHINIGAAEMLDELDELDELGANK